MIPENRLSTEAFVAGFNDISRGAVEYLQDYERAGVALYDGSQGMRVKVWTCRAVDKKEVQISAPSVPWTSLFTRANDIKELAIAFDNNMFPFVTFTEVNNDAFIWWYDSSDNTQKFTLLPAGSITPRCCIDEHRPSRSASSDVVLAYLRGGALYVRYQRERYDTEHLLQSGLGDNARIVEMGMNRRYRLQFWLRDANPVAGAAVFTSPFLGDVVTNLCRRVGLPVTALNTSELYDDRVYGYGISTTESVASVLKPLAQAFFFDPAEYDRKLWFVKRGKSPVIRITYRDLVSDTPHAMKRTRRREDKLPRRVNVNHIDPDGGYAKNKQSAHRRSNLVKTKNEVNITFAIVMPADQAAGVADKTIKMRWHEQMDYSFSLPLAYSHLVPTTVLEYEDEKGNIERVRIEQRNMDGNVIKFEGPQDGGAAVYETNAVGLSLPAPPSTTPGIIGETRVEVLNIAVLRDQDDELGVYVAAAGTTSAWFGYQLLLSTNEGLNYFEALRSSTPSTLGDTVTALLAEVSAEYPSAQTVVVTSNYPLESITRAALMSNGNRCVIGDEVLQFETAEFLGGDQYRLGGLVRGRYATDPAAWPAGTRFVLIDSTVSFLQAQQWMLGKDLLFKPVSLGLTEDETVPVAYLFDEAVNQTEWQVDRVAATRDGSDNVTVTFIGRGRLGIETAPYNSKHFAGYRIKYSDGTSVDTMLQSYTRAATPAAVTITVHALNAITGEGPASLGVLI